jgi:hypothetical protein
VAGEGKEADYATYQCGLSGDVLGLHVHKYGWCSLDVLALMDAA